MIIRDSLGRVKGSGFAFNHYDEDTSYFDKKVSQVRFAKHNDDKPSKVTTYKIINGEMIKVN